MYSPDSQFFKQIVSETHQLLRLHLKRAQGHSGLDGQIAERARAIDLKQAILNGIKPHSDA